MEFSDNLHLQSACCSEERYPILRTMITWYKFLGWITIIGALIVSFMAGLLFDARQSIPFIMFTMFLGITGFINFLAFGQGLSVILAIEENTRK